ncbi:MAG: hypothetical protein K9G62_03470 [Alphaproteobacteria bacterium]|nr:hypothetical protein [Alphaproteobacteria bacterium]
MKDIILDQNGKASMAVVADGEFPGFDGKLVAFDYNLVARQNEDGDVVMPLTEDSIEKAAEFSYERGDQSSTVRVIPNNAYSVAELLDADLVDPEKDYVAQVENISFKNGHANQLILAFDQVLGLGGERAAIGYNKAKLIRNGDELDFQLTANQAAQFESYKKTSD